MRIISGKRKGKIIIAPKELPVRPTTDKAKESLFNILNNTYEFEELEVLDLFAGTGNLTYEFVSRGSKWVTAVDIEKNCIHFIKKTSENLNFKNISAVQSDFNRFLEHTTLLFDIVFADPPYNMDRISEIPDAVFDNGILKDEGLLIVEHPKEISFENHPRLFDHRIYGRVNFSFFQ